MINKTKLEFKPEDFNTISFALGLNEEQKCWVAQKSQARFDAWLSEGVRVSGWWIPSEKRWTSGTTTEPTDTHTALLVCIEEIQRTNLVETRPTTEKFIKGIRPEHSKLNRP